MSPPSSPIVREPLAPPAAQDSPSILPIRSSTLVDSMSPRSTTSLATDRSTRAYVSKIGILPSSLPAYHRDYMEARRTGRNVGNTLSTAHSEVDEPHPQTDAEKAETARRLNPHSRSQLKLDEASKRPAALTPVPQKKAKPTKWQFGIRSRNQPLEAIGCIYRALQKLGAEWTLDEDWEPPRSDSAGDDRCVYYYPLENIANYLEPTTTASYRMQAEPLYITPSPWTTTIVHHPTCVSAA